MFHPFPGPTRPARGVDVAVIVEFVAAALFALLAGVAYDALAIAAAFAATMFVAAFASGAHVSPSVSVAAGLSGHAPWQRVLMYVAAQVAGSLAGTASLLALVPGLRGGAGPSAPACHGPLHGLGGTALFSWEALLTFVFVYVVYGATLHPPGHGAVAPLSAGVALFACLATGGSFTGLSPLSPAVTFASSLVFDCYWRQSWVYLLGQLTGAGVAALLAAYAYGRGPYLLDDDQRAAYAAAYGGAGAQQQGGGFSRFGGGGGGPYYEPLMGGGGRERGGGGGDDLRGAGALPPAGTTTVPATAGGV